jgi:hypothetical protein
MKICLLSRGRTRSTVIANCLSKKFDVPNVGEEYFKAQWEIKRSVDHRKHVDWNSYIPVFENKISEITKNLFNKQSFVCKIFPSMLIAPPQHIINHTDTLEKIKPRIIFCVGNYLQLSKYDKIFFLDRDFKQSVLSWVYSNKTAIYHKYKNKTNTYQIIKLNEVDLARAKFYILEYILQQKLKKFLTEKSISYTIIDDNNFQEILKTHNDDLEKTPISYTELIYRSNDLINNIEQIHNEYSSIIDEWSFQ